MAYHWQNFFYNRYINAVFSEATQPSWRCQCEPVERGWWRGRRGKRGTTEVRELPGVLTQDQQASPTQPSPSTCQSVMCKRGARQQISQQFKPQGMWRIHLRVLVSYTYSLQNMFYVLHVIQKAQVDVTKWYTRKEIIFCLSFLCFLCQFTWCDPFCRES